MGRPSIRDVAREAGVSTATVSHVINNTRFVSPATRLLVVEAIEKLGYLPSSSARSLASNRSRIVGVIFSELINPFYASVYKGLEDTLSAAGFDIILANTGERPERQETALETLFARNVDGLILAPTGNPSKMLDKLIEDRTPVVTFDRRVPEYDLPYVGINNEAAAYEAVCHLIKDGHRRIGLISGLEKIHNSVERRNGYIRALQEHDLDVDPCLIYHGDSQQRSGFEGARGLLSCSNTPTALFVTNNLMTLGALHALREMGLRCPEDVGLVGFDDHDWADIFTPPITTVRQPTYELGRTAAQLLVQSIEERAEGNLPRESILPTSLIVRGSCSSRCLTRYEPGFDR